MTMNAETPRRLSGAFQKNLAGGEAEPSVEHTLPEGEADVFVELWAEAKVYYTARVFPRYGSPAWIALPPDDPRRLASALHAAEMWRKYGDEDALLAWFRDASRARPPLAERPSRAELDEAAKPKPAHQLRATPGWPPIRIPGQPGRYLRYVQERRAA
jgi:hypothetical protein